MDAGDGCCVFVDAACLFHAGKIVQHQFGRSTEGFRAALPAHVIRISYLLPFSAKGSEGSGIFSASTVNFMNALV